MDSDCALASMLSATIVALILGLAVANFQRHAEFLHVLNLNKSQINEHTKLVHITSDRGFLLCSSAKMAIDVIKMVWQIRHFWKSELPIAIAHCEELHILAEALKSIDPWITLLDVCKDHFLTVEVNERHQKLRGFSCKPAAIVLSPFDETMFVDLDVVWFKSPDLLFSSPQYMRTGTLFFRDRFMWENEFLNTKAVMNFFASNGIGKSPQEMAQLLQQGGISLFWRSALNAVEYHGEKLSQYQDSSVVLIHKSRHPQMLMLMEKHLFSFDIGYGDKEMYWIMATLAREPFSFSPFMAGQYTDCFGIIIHFDPSFEDRPELAEPFYANGEFMVEEELTTVGDFVSGVMTSPLVVTADIPFVQYLPWKAKRGDPAGCACRNGYQCQAAPPSVDQHFLFSQWLYLSLRLGRFDDNESQCVPVLAAQAAALGRVFAANVSLSDCQFHGCPALPLTVDMGLAWNPAFDDYCEPISFSEVQPPALRSRARSARQPHCSEGQLLENTESKETFVCLNGSVHRIVENSIVMQKSLTVPVDLLEPKYFDILTFGADYDEKDAVVMCGVEIYTIYDGQRHLVRELDLLHHYGYSESKYRRMSEVELGAYPLGLPLIRYNSMDPTLKCPGDRRVFTVSGGEAHVVEQYDFFVRQGFHPDRFNTMNKYELELYKLLPKEVLKDMDEKDPAIVFGDDTYTMYEGHLHLVRDKSLLKKYGYDDGDYFRVSAAAFSTYPSLGLPLIRYRDMSPTLMLPGSNHIYVVTNNCTAVAVSDYDWFVGQGYHPDAFNVMTEEELATHKIAIAAQH